MDLEIPDSLINLLRRCQRAAALSGAGISAESGVPTFREARSSLWARYDPQDLATPQAFERDPRLVWEWYTWRRGRIKKATPNPGHFALAQMAGFIPEFNLITQNVDGLHQQAGSPLVIELHGNIMRTRCTKEKRLVENCPPDTDLPPRCPDCGELLRPDVVWFGESLPMQALESAYLAAETSEIFLSIGTSTLVEPAASLPFLALEQGAVVVEINPQRTPLTSSATYVLAGPSGVVLPAMIQAVWRSPIK